MKTMYQIIVICLFFILIAGCGGKSQPSAFYILAPISDKSGLDVAMSRTIAIGVGPVVFPRYLHKAQIVTQKSAHQLHLAEFNRWAEPVDKNFTSVLAENLSRLISTDRIYLYPWRGYESVDYQVALTVNRFIMTEEGNAELSVRWAIIDEDKKAILLAQTSKYHSQSSNVGDYNATVAAMNKNLTSFSRDLSYNIKTLVKIRGAQLSPCKLSNPECKSSVVNASL